MINLVKKTLLLYIGPSVLILLAICTLRVLVYFPTPLEPELCADTSDHKMITDSRGLVDRFTQALKFKTITKGPRDYDANELIKLIQFIKENYPLIHGSKFITREIVANYSLLYTIKGTDPKLRPYMLCAHLDVVPVEEDKWDFDPFGGPASVKDGIIYGRGTIDYKDSLVAILEAFEYLLETGFRPKRSFYIAFGHDEEGSGYEGAVTIAALLQTRGVRNLEFILDEGSVITHIPGYSGLVALIGVVEKGYLTVTLKAKGNAGHASMTPYETPIVKLSKSLAKFHSNVHPNLFGKGPEKCLFEELAPHVSFPFKLIYGNLWLLNPIFSYLLSLNPLSNGLVRTTTAVTMVNGGFKENVIPSEVTATINHRIHPKQSVKEIFEFDRKLINDESIDLQIIASIEPSPVSPHGSDSFGYQIIKRSIRQVFQGVVVVPGVMVASTDTKWYLNLTDSVYRFSPLILKPEESILFHGHNERISIDNYIKFVNYFHHIITNSDQSEIPDKPKAKDEL